MSKRAKRGRPKTAKGPRTRRVVVLLHEGELLAIERAAGKRSLSEYLRSAGLKPKTK